MARMHSKKRGKSSSKRPQIKVAPDWVKLNSKEIEELIVKMAKQGMNSTIIGLRLRDEYGIPNVRVICKKTITQIMKDNGIKIDYPDDLLNLIKKAVRVRKHLSENKRDIHNRIKLSHTEAKIKRLVRYYRRIGKLPADWVYDPDTAALLVK
ncbi:30S ribosomal protein S15 [Candidatus Micrarchaeota archaeon]|nr:30S ribosomal protein S15 [Candidatus Micrarchaeota archaeon]